ncbi:MAG: leucine-rich repeat domain-containing protein [Kiritimatiellia bacterium]
MNTALWRSRINILILLAGALAARAESLGPYPYEIINDEAWITGFDWSYVGDLVITNRLGRYPVTTIGDWAFTRHYGLQSVTIPDSVRAIGAKAFGWCYGLCAVTIPDGLTTIGGEGTFIWCMNLTHIVIGNKITAIGDGAFDNCRSLSRICFRGNAPRLGWRALAGTLATVYYLPGPHGWGPPMGIAPLCYGIRHSRMHGLPMMVWCSPL